MYRMDWTDDRLHERFDSIDRRFDEVGKGFEQVDKRFDRVDDELKRLGSKFDGLQRTLVHGVIALTSAFFAAFAAMIVLISTQL